MENYQELQKIIKKGKKIQKPETLMQSLQKKISTTYNTKNARELNFLTLYYGLQGEALTLENIGLAQTQPLTRERVRQIIDASLKDLKQYEQNNLESDDNPYKKSSILFHSILAQNSFLRIDELLSHDYFKDFKKNTKGLISFLNDCDIRQIAYRKNYYFYPKTIDRKKVIQLIQKENKVLRREVTIEKMNHKSKTVTYVPDQVREFLLEHARKENINLNPLYEKILTQFMEISPYSDDAYIFPRTQSWKARKGKAQWQQIGIYIKKEVFDEIKKNINKIKIDITKNVSLMSFISQAFVWYYEKNNK